MSGRCFRMRCSNDMDIRAELSKTSDFGTAWRGELAAKESTSCEHAADRVFGTARPSDFIRDTPVESLAVTADLRLMVRLHA